MSMGITYQIEGFINPKINLKTTLNTLSQTHK